MLYAHRCWRQVCTSLQFCPTNSYSELITDLSVDYITKSGLSPLFVTCANGHYDICALLLKHGTRYSLQLQRARNMLISITGASVNPKGKNVVTPLWIAASKGHHSIVFLLRQHKAKVPMDAYAMTHPELTLYDTKQTKAKFNGRTPYDEALKNGHEKVVEVLKK